MNDGLDAHEIDLLKQSGRPPRKGDTIPYTSYPCWRRRSGVSSSVGDLSDQAVFVESPFRITVLADSIAAKMAVARPR